MKKVRDYPARNVLDGTEAFYAAGVAPGQNYQVPLSAILAGSNDSLLQSWALVQAFRVVSAVRDANEAITTAQIVWPDGTPGVFETLVFSSAFPGAIDSWRAVYQSGAPKTITQPTVTRDAAGAVIAQPAITIV